MKIHHDTNGTWKSVIAMDLDSAEGHALLLCKAAIKLGKDITVLFENRGQVDRVMLTFAQDPDNDPYIGYRMLEATTALGSAKKLAEMGDLELGGVLRNYDA